MVGVNVPIPVPLPFFSFTGWRGSFAGERAPLHRPAPRRCPHDQPSTSGLSGCTPDAQKHPVLRLLPLVRVSSVTASLSLSHVLSCPRPSTPCNLLMQGQPAGLPCVAHPSPMLDDPPLCACATPAPPRQATLHMYSRAGVQCRTHSFTLAPHPTPPPSPNANLPYSLSPSGDLHMYGRAGVQFYTQTKTVTAKWPSDDVRLAAADGGSSSSGGGGAGSCGGGKRERLPGLDRVGAS